MRVLKADLSGGDPARRLQQSDDRGPGQRLAGPGLANHAQDLARSDVEGDVVDSDKGALAGGKPDAEVPDLQRASAMTIPTAGADKRTSAHALIGDQSPTIAATAPSNQAFDKALIKPLSPPQQPRR